MKINTAEMNVNAFKPRFKSIRTDKKTVEQLKTGEKPILENNRQNIYAALNSLSSASDRTSIEFLLDVAKNLAYGQGGDDSEFKSFLDEEGLTSENRENTDWSKVLDDTIRRALSSSLDNVTDLEAEYNEIFNTKKPLTEQQKKILDLRNDFTSLIIGEDSLKDSETLARTARVRKNLDYFIASSEIPLSQKQECLEKFIFFMGDEYKITPQLADKKLQVMDEMLNDMIVKTPQDDVLTIKSVDQRQSGMCAAISICRKAMAYEDKSKYVDLIMEELKDSPVMSVYDVTELGSGKKVDIPKTIIDYDTAIAKGYRIIDASAHNWMHNAHASGDGTIQTEYYVPFDEENYGIFNDSSWYLGLDPKYSNVKSLLMSVIKEKELLKSCYRTRKNMSDTYNNLTAVKKEYYDTQKSVNGKLSEVFSDIFPEKSNEEISSLIKSLKDFYTGKTPENGQNVPSKLPKDEKQRIIADFVISSVPDITDSQKEKIGKNAVVLFAMLDEYNRSELQLKKLKSFSSPRSKYLFNKKLYNAAAAHRIAVESDVNMPDGIVRFERLSGLPPRDIQISNYLKTINSGLKSASVRQRFADENGNIPSSKSLETDLLSDIIKLESFIPSELDSITNTLFEKSVTELVITIFENIAQNIKEGDREALENVKVTMGIKGDKHDVTEKLNKWVQKLSSNPSNEEVLDGIRLLGYEDRMHFVSVFMSHYMQSLQEGISEEQYNKLVKTFGGEDKVGLGIESQREKFEALTEEYNSILEKWQIPSARTQILKQLEKQHFIVSRTKLDMLKNHFSSIEQAMVANEKIEDSKQRQKANSKLYQFTSEETEIFESIKKSLSKMKKYCEMEYQNLNNILYDALEDQYSNIGMLNGQFWVREEGSSGLAANEQIRIIEQMTGKPYHMETDAIAASEKIKKGNGSGIQCLSVDDSDYAFHAQYVPSVTTETFTNPITGKKIIQDVMWTDNSWGKAEKEYFWNGRNGFLYTDYGNGYGWKDGFILADDYKIGLPVKDIYGAIGYNKEDGDKFGLFTDVVLPGAPIDLYQKLYKMFGYIFNIDEGKKYYAALENAISSGYKIKIDELEGLDSVAEAKVEMLTKRIEKELKSEADFENLPDDDELKLVFKKLAVYMSTNNPMLADTVFSVNNNKDLETVKDEIFQEHLDVFSSIIGKSDETIETLYEYSYDKLNSIFDEIKTTYGLEISEPQRKAILEGIFFNEDALAKHNGTLSGLEKYFEEQIESNAIANIKDQAALDYFITNAKKIILQSIDERVRIKSLDSLPIVNSPLKDEFIAAVDKYLNPSSDEELLTLIQGLQMADYDTVDKFFEVLQPEDIGLKERKPYDYVKMYLSGDSSVSKAFSELISSEEIYKNLPASNDEQEGSSPEELYRSLYVKLSEMDVQKYIKAFKAEAFQKYKVRQAFPEPVVISDESISKIVDGMYSSIIQHVDSIESSKYVYEILSKYHEINDKFLTRPLFTSLLNRQDVVPDEESKAVFNSFISEILELQELSGLDPSFEIINEPLNKLISVLKSSDTKFEGRVIGPVLNEIISIFSDLESTGITTDRFVQLKQEEISALKYNIQLMVNTNIEPKYRDEVLNEIYRLIDMYRKGYDEESLLYEKEKINDLVITKHIVKNPTVLLKECVRMLQEGKQNTDEYEILRAYLENALQVAQQTKIQYKLVQNQHEAISSKTKDMLSMFGVTMKDGTRENMDSEIGMLYLIEQLKNTGDNYTILNLFLEQSGLSQQALNALINNFEIQKTNDLVQEKAEEIKIDLAALDELASLVGKYSGMNKGNVKSLPDSVEQFRLYIKRKLKGKENISVFSKFVNYIDSIQYTDALKDTNSTMIEPLTKQIIEDALQYVAEDINSQMKYISDISSMLKERIELIASIRVPSESEAYKNRTDFFHKYEQVQNYISEESKKIFDALGNSEFLSAQMIPC